MNRTQSRQVKSESTPLYRFLESLQADPSLELRFRTDPAAVMREAGLSARERQALSDGPEAVTRLIGGKTVAMTAMTGIVTVPGRRAP